MITEFHFIRPWWFLSLIPLILLTFYLARQTQGLSAWSKVCDSHLLPFLIQTKPYHRRYLRCLPLFISGALMILSLAGPTWSRFPVPTYAPVQPRVVVMDMSDAMLVNDLSPDRLSRAKFKLHDLFQYRDAGQFALVVYTAEPFVVSPLTEDGQTIDALLSSLTPDIMPVQGQNLGSALMQAAELIKQSGFAHGQLLVLSASVPSVDAIDRAKSLARNGIHTSVLPVIGPQTSLNPLFTQLAKAGDGVLIPFKDTPKDLEQWIASSQGGQTYRSNGQHEIPIWRDQGRWFLIPALLLLLPACRKGWIEGLGA